MKYMDWGRLGTRGGESAQNTQAGMVKWSRLPQATVTHDKLSVVVPGLVETLGYNDPGNLTISRAVHLRREQGKSCYLHCSPAHALAPKQREGELLGILEFL